MKSGLLIIAFLVVLSGCAGPNRADSTAPHLSGVPSRVDSDRRNATNDSSATNISRNAEREGVIQVGDNLLVTFGGLPDLPAWDQRVKPDGTITLIYNRVFHAAGKKTSDLEKEIRDYYVPRYFTELTVAVRISCETACVYVDGEVRNPGRYPWTNGMTLKDAIEAAGGFTEFFNHRITLIHSNGATGRLRLRGDWARTNNPVLNPGDRIHNPRQIL